MISSVISTTSMLVFASLGSKLLLSQPVSNSASKAYELLRNCLQWKDMAYQDTDIVLRLQHASTAAAFLQAARIMARDAELERASGIDINNLAIGLEKTTTEARDMLNIRRAKTASV